MCVLFSFQNDGRDRRKCGFFEAGIGLFCGLLSIGADNESAGLDIPQYLNRRECPCRGGSDGSIGQDPPASQNTSSSYISISIAYMR